MEPIGWCGDIYIVDMMACKGVKYMGLQKSQFCMVCRIKTVALSGDRGLRDGPNVQLFPAVALTLDVGTRARPFLNPHPLFSVHVATN